jgi:hypothetical protein
VIALDQTASALAQYSQKSLKRNDKMGCQVTIEQFCSSTFPPFFCILHFVSGVGSD